jgi:hypothetical protein
VNKPGTAQTKKSHGFTAGWPLTGTKPPNILKKSGMVPGINYRECYADPKQYLPL